MPGERRPSIPLTSWTPRVQDGPRSVGGEFTWLHFSLATTATERWLERYLNLPEGYFHSLTEHASSARLEQEDEAIVAVVHDVSFEFGLDPENISTVALCFTPALLVTARLRPVRSVGRLHPDRGVLRPRPEA